MKEKKNLQLVSPYQSEDRSGQSEDWVFADWNEFLFDHKEGIFNNLLHSVNISKYPEIEINNLTDKLSGYTNIQKKNLLLYSGSDEALSNIFDTFVDESKSVLIFSPTYSQVIPFILKNTNKMITSEINNPFKNHEYNFDDINKADLIYIVNPNNPTGKVIENHQIQELLKTYPDKLFVLDEAYYEFSEITSVELISKYKNLIITRTFSKAFGLAGLRIGYLMSCDENISSLKKIKNIKSPNSISIEAASRILDNLEYYKLCIASVKNSKNKIYSVFDDLKIEYIKSEANFILFREINIHKFALKLKNNKYLIRDRSSIKNIENSMRLTVGNNKHVEIFLENLIEFYS